MKRFRSCTRAFIVCLLIALPAVLTAQQARRPRIAIALSGGASLGFAHIGVLRYLEEHRIPVDAIAGTSIGGLLGGLYATGHSADDLEKIVQDGDWDALLRSTSQYEDRSVSEKQEWNRITGFYSIPLGGSLSLPSGIHSGQALVQLLSGKTAAYWDVQNFDNLPIPFRCVATDLLSGEAFVLSEGRLPQALRATMAIPGIFTPVDWKGRLLADGGLVNNLPTDVAKNMGADVVIGVTLRVAPTTVHELRTLTEVVRQTINIAVTQNEQRNRSLANVEIIVELGNRSSLNFQDAKSVIDAGYRAAQQNESALQRFSVSETEWQDYLRQKASRERTMPASGRVVQVSADNASIAKSATTELQRKAGDGISTARLEQTLNRLSAVAALPNAFFGWRAAPSPAGYQVELDSRKGTEVLLRPSFFYQLSGREPGRPTLRIAASATPKDAYKARFVGALFIGSDPGVSLEYYHPFSGSAYFVAPGFSFDRTRFSEYTPQGRSDQTRTRSSGALYFGAGTWRQVQLRAGIRGGFDSYSSAAVGGAAPVSNTGFANPEVVGIINSQDSGTLPTRGLRVNARSGYSFRKHSFPYLEMNFDHFQPVARDLSLFVTGRVDTSMGRRLTFYDQYTAGGLGQLDAYRYQEIRGDSLLIGGLGFIYRGMNPKNASFRPIWGAWYNAAAVDPRTTNSYSKQSATAAVFTPTPLGLVGLSVGMDLKGSVRWRLSIGSFWNRP
jgi:NTE family protein